MIKKLKIFIFRCAFYLFVVEVIDSESEQDIIEFEKYLTNIAKDHL